GTLQKKRAPKSAQGGEVERRAPLTLGGGPTRRCGDRLARLDDGAADRAGTVGDARGEGNADDQRRADKGHHYHLEVGKAVGGKQRKIVHDKLPKDVPLASGGKKIAAGVVRLRRLLSSSRVDWLAQPNAFKVAQNCFSRTS